MGKKYLAEVLTNELVTIYDEPRRYLGLRMLAFSGEGADPDEPAYHEFAIVGARALDYPYEVGCKLLVECSEDQEGHLQLGRVKVLQETA